MNRLTGNDIRITHGLPPVADKETICAFDTEFFGMDKSRLHRPHGTFASMACTYDGVQVYYITDVALIPEFMSRIDKALWVGQNIAFDIRQLRMFSDVLPRKRIWDTMLCDQIRFRGYYDDFALNDLYRRYCGGYLDKTQQKSFNKTSSRVVDKPFTVAVNLDGMLGTANGPISDDDVLQISGWTTHSSHVSREELDDLRSSISERVIGGELIQIVQATEEPIWSLSSEQIIYGALDVVATYRVAVEQREQIDEQDLWIWQNIERPFMWVLLDIGGIRLDTDKWMRIATEKGDIAAKAWQECWDEYGINIRSPKQILQFFGENKIKLESTNVTTLSANVKKHPIIQKILDYRKPAKGSSTYGAGWVDDHVEEDGLVYASWNQMGARSGRMSCSSPNLQNIPVRTDPIYRDCFIAEDDYDLIISDWSSQEPRITAFFSQDGKLITIFQSGEDIYISVGYHIFGEKFDKKDPRRKDMKALVLGLTYGMTKYGLAEKINVPDGEDPVEYAQHLIDRFMQEFPGVKKYIQNKIKEARTVGYVTTIYGRKCWISPYEKGLERDAPNYPVQGSAADAMKLASIRIHDTGKAMFGYSPIRMFIHDELVCSVKQEHTASAKRLIEDVMVYVAEEMHSGIPAKADVYVGKSWSEKQ